MVRGTETLADYEVLEMLLFLSARNGDTKPTAKELINRFGSFAKVLAAPEHELLKVPKVGPHAVSTLKLVRTSALRTLKAAATEAGSILNSWTSLLGYLQVLLAHERVEQFRVLFLDSKNRLIADEVQARGTVNHTAVYPREVIKRALELHATALILVHNHPSGDPTPSLADIEMTQQVQRAAAALEIMVHDHLIMGNGRHTSFRSEGLL